VRRFRGGGRVRRKVSITNTASIQTKQIYSNISSTGRKTTIGMHSKLIGLQASVLRNVGSTHGKPIISKISFSERGNMSWESRRRLLEIQMSVILLLCNAVEFGTYNPELSNFSPLSKKIEVSPRLIKQRTRTYTDFAANLRSLWNMVPPVHPTTAVQYVSGSAQIKSTRR
jgi:hypothetical protein